MKWLGVIAMAAFVAGSCSQKPDDGLFADSSPLAPPAAQEAHNPADAAGPGGGQK